MGRTGESEGLTYLMIFVRDGVDSHFTCTEESLQLLNTAMVERQAWAIVISLSGNKLWIRISDIVAYSMSTPESREHNRILNKGLSDERQSWE